jgi:hypothetical protein
MTMATSFIGGSKDDAAMLVSGSRWWSSGREREVWDAGLVMDHDVTMNMIITERIGDNFLYEGSTWGAIVE